ncbi:Crp/Fnr family transcriptional regulator [Cuneatibacter sp. NSJ-177]|uniref:Crp/Fnr family transcriptional regulator n=1 Tax=Cuneatibacter sp. NSJ-177 TaxID=2931401 RepID=UPI001FD1FED1|nr:Crp/Fnr family transcriptional regulator [Cuneatibacter sp. NSJ-177]MCJ7835866.1 Crp/Fnr family transcriptional regulator [Cuneatibacter sp. NSJ-177]
MKNNSDFHFPFEEHLTSDEKELIQNQVRTIRYSAGQAIRSAGDGCLGILFVTSGVLRVYLSSEEGKEATISRVTAGEPCVLSASCVLSAITFEVQIDAETDSEVLILPSSCLSVLMGNNIYVENFIYRSATECFSDVIGAVERLLFFSLEQRLASFLLDESARLKTSTLSLTHEQIAQSIGSAREAVSRTLKQMAKTGCLGVLRGEIQILDRKKLYEMVR